LPQKIDLGQPDAPLPVNLGTPDAGFPLGQQMGAAVGATTPLVVKGLARGATSALPDAAAMMTADVPIVSGLAGAAAEGARRMIDNALGLQLPGEKKMTGKEIVGSAVTEGVKQMVFSGVAKAFGYGITGLRNTIVGKIGEAGQRALQEPEAARALDIATRKDIPLTHAEITQATIPKIIQKVATAQPLSKNVAVEAEKRTVERVVGLLNDVRQPLGQLEGRVATGEIVQKALNESEDKFKVIARGLYDANRREAAQAGIEIPRASFQSGRMKIQKEIDDFKKYFEKTGDVSSGLRNVLDSIEGIDKEIKVPASKILGPGGKPITPASTQVKKAPALIPWAQVDDMRQELNEIIQSDKETARGRAVAKLIQGELTDVMDSAAQKAGGAVESSWKEARSFWEDGKAIFDNHLYKQVMTAAPEAVAESIGPTDTTKLKKVMTVLRDPKIGGNTTAEDAFRLRWVTHHITGGETPERATIAKMQDKLNEMDPEFKKILFGNDARGRAYQKDLEEIAFVMQKSRQVTTPGIAGTLAEQQAAHEPFRAAISIALWKLKSIPMTVARQMVGPVLAKIAFDPEATKLLLQGAYQMEKRPSAGINYFLRSIDLATKEGKVFQQYQESKSSQ
jgi:hypothetical protein